MTATKHASIYYLTYSHRVTSLVLFAEHRQVGLIIWPDKTQLQCRLQCIISAVYSLKFHLRGFEAAAAIRTGEGKLIAWIRLGSSRRLQGAKRLGSRQL